MANQVLTHEFDVLFHRCSANGYGIASWLSDIEFIDEMQILKKSGVYFCDETILPIMKRIYDERDLERKRYPDFNFRLKRHTIYQIERAIANKERSD